MRTILLLFLSCGLVACGSTRDHDEDPRDSQVVDIPTVTVESEVDPAPEAEVAPEPEVATEPEAEVVDPRFDKRFRKGLTRGGRFTVLWRPLGDAVPKNEHFELEVWLYRSENGGFEPLPGARLAVSGWMPDHGHGMIRKPRASDRGDGSYLVKGMLLQMGGHWQVFFDVLVDNQSERAQFDLVL